jgi:hypothetical protein
MSTRLALPRWYYILLIPALNAYTPQNSPAQWLTGEFCIGQVSNLLLGHQVTNSIWGQEQSRSDCPCPFQQEVAWNELTSATW